jgi:hypothetical protein
VYDFFFITSPINNVNYIHGLRDDRDGLHDARRNSPTLRQSLLHDEDFQLKL